jgi:hypothetical protein
MKRFRHWLDEPFNPVALLLGVLVAALRYPFERLRGRS